VEYVITGLLVVEVAGVPPGKVHSQLVAFNELVLVKVTLEPAQTETGLAVKLAVGGEVTVTAFVILIEPQLLLLEVSVTL
jgi:hypothetical protein